ncbi:hypothetical protein [Streptomyces lavendulae]|uniref:hypothetical protein n=1 Tax=Streptomyces lavendulae TaxID=1914 RepID=UPI0033E6F1EC
MTRRARGRTSRGTTGRRHDAQWAYDSRPLYTFINDKMAGDMTGDGFKDVWHAAQP